jgi:hypothetical protein
MSAFFENLLTPPKKLKGFYDWAKIIVLFGGIAYAIVGWAIDDKTGQWIGAMVAIGVALIWVLATLFLHVVPICDQGAEKLINDATSVDLAKQLRHARWYVWTLVGFVVVFAGAVATESWMLGHRPGTDLQPEPRTPETKPPVTKELPLRLSPELAAYFNPARDLVNPKFPDFVQRLIERLIKEGNATMKPSEVAILQTAPLEHAAPAMTLTIPSESAIRALSPIAFLVTTHEGRRKYEQVPVEYPDSARILIRLPAASVGDRILIISRVTSLEKAANFPADVADLLKFTSIQGD